MPARIEYLSDAEVADLMGVSRVTVCRLYHKGPRPGANFDLRDCEPVVCGRIRRWRRDYVISCLAHQPVPTDTWRRNHMRRGTAPTDPARLPADATTPPTGDTSSMQNAECTMQNEAQDAGRGLRNQQQDNKE